MALRGRSNDVVGGDGVFICLNMSLDGVFFGRGADPGFDVFA
jgi:hypothetical protein